MKIVLPDDVRHILHILNNNGHAAYAVGGCVRDCLMGHAPQDWDITTSAAPPQVKALFPRTIDTGLQHGTVTVMMGRARYEVTTFRVDGVYLDGRRPSEVTFTDHIEEDLSRRDFTINAIAYHPDSGFTDPFSGRADIEKKVIRCVGRAEHRFNEDALRMLRAVRFAAQLEFTIAPDTLAAIAPLSRRLALVSAERIHEELTRLLMARHPEAAVLLESTGLLSHVLRGRAYEGNLYETVQLINKCPKQTAMVYALFLAWAGSQTAAILRELRFDNKTARETIMYVTHLPAPLPVNRYEIKKMLNIIPPDYFNNLLTLKMLRAASQVERDAIEAARAEAADIIKRGECFTLNRLAVNGDDLVNAGIPQGKPTGDMLAYLLDAVMRDPSLNEQSILLSRINATRVSYASYGGVQHGGIERVAVEGLRDPRGSGG